MQTHIQKLIAEIRQDLTSKLLAPAIATGMTLGFVEIVIIISLSALVFGGDLAVFVPRAASLWMLGAFIQSLINNLATSYRGIVIATQDSSAAVMAVLVAAIVVDIPGDVSQNELFLILIAAIGLTTLLTGIGFFIVGALKLGNQMRFIPFPVIGGFLAGTGWLLVDGGFSTMTGQDLTLDNFAFLIEPESLLRWGGPFLIGLIMLLISRRVKSPWVLPLTLIGTVGLFYMILFTSGTTISEARAGGWILSGKSQQASAMPLDFASLLVVDWRLILGEGGNILIVMVTSLVALLLNAAGIEVAVNQEIDLDQELSTAGVANIAGGLVGGAVVFLSITSSTLGKKIGLESRLVGISFSFTVLVGVLFGSILLAYFPTPVLGVILFFFGLSFLAEWLYDGWFSLSKIDYVFVVFIITIVATLGFLQGFMAGMLLAVAMFVINYSRVKIISHELDGNSYSSNVDRIGVQRILLRIYGKQVCILKLRGYIFFGTANNLLARVRERVADLDTLPLRYLVLDFRFVSDMDSSAMNSFAQMKQLAENHSFMIILTNLTSSQQAQFVRENLHEDDSASVRFFPDLDHGIEWCEEQVLYEFKESIQTRPTGMLELLKRNFPKGKTAEKMMKYLEFQEFPAEHILIQQGAPPDCMYFIESGKVTIILNEETGPDLRLRTMTNGAVVGEMQVFLKSRAAASVITETPCVVYRLSIKALDEMEKKDSTAASELHKYIIRLLSERIIDMNHTLEVVLD